MSLSTESVSASKLLSQTNELREKLARLNSNVELYRQVYSLQQNFNSLEEKYKLLIKTSACNAQCDNLNTKSDENSVDNFLMKLLLSKSESTLPPPPTLLVPSAPPEEILTLPNTTISPL
jgi:hypothetical protein